jgi:hypothetical protein
MQSPSARRKASAAAVEPEPCREDNVQRVGRVGAVRGTLLGDLCRAKFEAPAVKAITEAARSALFQYR